MPNKKIITLMSAGLVASLAFLGLASCGSDSSSDSSITIYSGRNESLISPILARFERQSGVKVNVKYGSSTDLALLIQEEGDKSPADVFISQSPGAVGFLASRDLLADVPDSVRQKVVPAYRAEDRKWVGLTGRQRVVVYNPDLVSQDELPNSIDDLVRPEYRGRVGIAPMNGSFQDFVTAMRFERGDAQTETWLRGMAANNSPNYPKNSAIIAAVIAGEVEMGLVNHYYLLRELAENPGANGVNYYLPTDDVGSLLIVTSGSILKSSEKNTRAAELLEFMLSANEQSYFANELREYPLVAGVASPSGVPDLNAFSSPSLNNFARLGNELLNTVKLIDESGLIQG